MTDFGELGRRKFIEQSGLEDEDFEIIGKIHSLASDSLVSRVENLPSRFDDMYFYNIYLRKPMEKRHILGFLGDNKLKAEYTASNIFKVRGSNKNYYLDFSPDSLP